MGYNYKKRMSNRLPVHLEAEVIYNNEACVAFIKNISNHSIYVKLAHIKRPLHDMPKTDVILKLQLHTGRVLYLKCKKIWSDKNTPHSVFEHVAVEIIDPPKEYLDFYHTLYRGFNIN